MGGYMGLICYQIKKLEVNNNLDGTRNLDTVTTEQLNVFFHEKEHGAVARLSEFIEAEEESLFSLQLVLEGIFMIQRVKSDAQKDEAFRKFYRKLFPIAAQIIQDITVHCDIIDGIRIQPNPSQIHRGSESEEKSNKIINFPTEE